jgi:three-Cys-motif partner protein
MAKQSFGGDWTEDKLQRVEEYFRKYNVALKNQPFRREYIDAFAGTGYREIKDDVDDIELMFPNLVEPEVQKFLDGSVIKALNVEPGFQQFTFIEKDPNKAEELRKLQERYPDKPIRVECGDANDWVQRICAENWNYRRAVLFLDPFGMQVSWQTLEAVAKTKSIDLWLLFPLGAAISRLLKRDGNINESLCKRLDDVFGERGWRQEFYKDPSELKPKEVQQSLFDEPIVSGSENPWKADFSVIEEYYRARLRTIFAKVADNSVWLTNSKNVPLYSLFFMAGNERGAPIAVKISESIMSRP